MSNPIIDLEYKKAKTEEQIKNIYLKYGFKISAMIRLRQINKDLSLKEMHDKVEDWRKE